MLLLRELADLQMMWTATFNSDGCIRLHRVGSEEVFTPLTAVYYHLTGKWIDGRSFWVEEMSLDEEVGFPWYEIIPISYAVISNEKYPCLRYEMLIALGLLKPQLELALAA